MSAFAEATRSAVIGTRQLAPKIVAGDSEADALFAVQRSEPPERTLLRAAAILATIRRATTMPPRFNTPFDPAEEETQPRCGPLATQDLRAMLTSKRAELLGEWLDAAAARGCRVAEELLPALLSRGAHSNAALRGLVARVCGERGRWLARHEDAWRYVYVAPDEAKAFAESENRGDRVRALALLRERDAPAARALLEESWPSEAGDDRRELLETLSVGLSLDDEPFLERARGDRRRDVRQVANALLHRLPDSQAARRAIALADSLVRVERRLLARSLVVELPATLTPEMEVLAVATGHPGQRAALLRELLALVPISHWRARFEIALPELLELALKDDLSAQLLSGFAGAVAAYRDEAALEALVAAAARDERLVDAAVEARSRFLDGRVSEESLIAALEGGSKRALDLVHIASRPWSKRFSVAALDLARRSVGEKRDLPEHARRPLLFTLIATFADPNVPNAGDGWPGQYPSDSLRFLVENLIDALSFRAAMHDHLRRGS